MAYEVSCEELKEWLEEGKRRGASHCIVLVDTWDLKDGFEDFPIYVMPEEDVTQVISRYPRGVSGIEVFVAQFDLRSGNLDQLVKEFDRSTIRVR